MDRRRALKSFGISVGGGIVIPSVIWTACNSADYTPILFTTYQLGLLSEIAETILPTTPDSPGAKSAEIALFLDVYFANCRPINDQQVITNGLTSIDNRCTEKSNKKFLEMSQSSRHDFLVQLDEEANKSQGTHYFSMLKSAILLGYFTSQVGATEALQYLPTPGKYTGDMTIDSNTKAWALG